MTFSSAALIILALTSFSCHAAGRPPSGHVSRPTDLPAAGVIGLWEADSEKSPGSPPPLKLLSTQTQAPASETAAMFTALPDAWSDVPYLELRWLSDDPDHLACSLGPPKEVPSAVPTAPPWAALVRRGNCSFESKMRAARQAGASAVIIANTADALFRAPNASQTKLLYREPIDPCSLDCTLGSAFVDSTTTSTLDEAKEACAAEPSCAANGGACELATPPSSSALSSSSSRGGGTDNQEPLPLRVCCIPRHYVDMFIGNYSGIAFRFGAVFVPRQAGEQLAAALRKSPPSSYSYSSSASKRGRRVLVKLIQRPRWEVDPSTLVIYLLGVGAALAASYRAARTERLEAVLRRALARGEDPTAAAKLLEQQVSRGDPDAETITMSSVVGFLCWASIALVVLFYLITSGYDVVVFVMIGVFSLGTIGALAHILIIPLMAALCPRRHRRMAESQLVLPCSSDHPSDDGNSARGGWLNWLCDTDDIPQDYAVAVAIATGLVVWWLVERHSWYAWVLQDTFAISYVTLFMVAVRLDSARIAAALLLAAFFYDIFMVFLSPLFFKKSVMVVVASGGKRGQPQANVVTRGPAEAPRAECVRMPAERMPMLLVVPSIFDWAGGQSMLGLGDIILPGLLLTFALRFDYQTLGSPLPASGGAGCLAGFRTAGCCCWLTAKPPHKPSRRAGSGGAGALDRRWGYFVITGIGYAVGLLLAFLANIFRISINGVRGQPALLYLVPSTLGPLVVVAMRRRELGKLWRGPFKDKESERLELNRLKQDGGGDDDEEEDGSKQLGGRVTAFEENGGGGKF